MIGLLILCSILGHGVAGLSMDGTGPGMWKVQYIQRCDEDCSLLDIEMNQHKINRTHDGWSGGWKLEQTLTYGFGIRIEIYKLLDGGYKLQHIMGDEEFINFIKAYVKDNTQALLEAGGVDPPDFPIPAGEYKVENFVLDYNELPRQGLYGEFRGVAFLLNGQDEIFCIECYLDFNECDDEE